MCLELRLHHFGTLRVTFRSRLTPFCFSRVQHRLWGCHVGFWTYASQSNNKSRTRLVWTDYRQLFESLLVFLKVWLVTFVALESSIGGAGLLLKSSKTSTKSELGLGWVPQWNSNSIQKGTPQKFRKHQILEKYTTAGKGQAIGS